LIGRDKLEFINGEITIPIQATIGKPTDDEKRTIRE
jgi:hypothetical protein